MINDQQQLREAVDNIKTLWRGSAWKPTYENSFMVVVTLAEQVLQAGEKLPEKKYLPKHIGNNAVEYEYDIENRTIDACALTIAKNYISRAELEKKLDSKGDMGLQVFMLLSGLGYETALSYWTGKHIQNNFKEMAVVIVDAIRQHILKGEGA